MKLICFASSKKARGCSRVDKCLQPPNQLPRQSGCSCLPPMSACADHGVGEEGGCCRQENALREGEGFFFFPGFWIILIILCMIRNNAELSAYHRVVIAKGRNSVYSTGPTLRTTSWEAFSHFLKERILLTLKPQSTFVVLFVSLF